MLIVVRLLLTSVCSRIVKGTMMNATKYLQDAHDITSQKTKKVTTNCEGLINVNLDSKKTVFGFFPILLLECGLPSMIFHSMPSNLIPGRLFLDTHHCTGPTTRRSPSKP
jgi:hypothetical protein